MLSSSPSKDSLLSNRTRLYINDDTNRLDGPTLPSISATPQNFQNTLQNIRSMHVAVRKNELDRIERENAKIAKKLYFAEPKLQSNKKMREQYNEHKKMSSNIA